ncbi:P-loop_containing nucleoside triphosphate hydrolase [Hexamita inflata]|uniref:P-loop containing nucleoside triphosphate hydrolase n=1 Tax=Hexamita inflata TaxID=28002 RepID=A0AA86QQB0_9EUKA|nr:P-loop containing nucleoside triphosphate hydrolase [Hexamita inflata]
MNQNFGNAFKVLIEGARKTGKSRLQCELLHKYYGRNEGGIDFDFETVKYLNCNIKLQIWDILGWAEEVDQRKNAHNSGNSESLLISFLKYKCQIFIHIILIFYVVNFSLQIGLEIQNKKVFFSNQVMFVYCIE